MGSPSPLPIFVSELCLMSYFKKFTDFCAAVAALAAGLFFIRKYMAFEPEEPPEISFAPTEAATDALEGATELVESATEKFPSKLEQFLEPAENADYTLLLPLIFLLLLSALLGRVFKRLPYVSFAISLLPAMLIAYMFECDLLYEQQGLFLILGALHVCGNLVECILRDREDGRHRLSIAAKISSATGAFVCFFSMYIGAQTLSEEKLEKIGHIRRRIMFDMTPSDVELLTTLGWMFVIVFAVSLIFYNVYFIDATLSLIPAGFVIYQTAGEFLTLAPLVFASLALLCTISHLLLMVFENNLSRKEQGKK